MKCNTALQTAHCFITRHMSCKLYTWQYKLHTWHYTLQNRLHAETWVQFWRSQCETESLEQRREGGSAATRKQRSAEAIFVNAMRLWRLLLTHADLLICFSHTTSRDKTKEQKNFFLKSVYTSFWLTPIFLRSKTLQYSKAISSIIQGYYIYYYFLKLMLIYKQSAKWLLWHFSNFEHSTNSGISGVKRRLCHSGARSANMSILY